ncbi:MAG: 2,3-bisphosphoglycerate-independent phosphoglycerate mutase [Parcubacteria group bacterium]
MLKPFVLLILDGWGVAPKNPGNAVELADKPNFDRLWKKFPHTLLHSHGRYVGLPHNQVGNSEAGHMNIGAGRRIEQDSLRISEEIKDGRFFKDHALLETINHAKENNSDLHLLGLVSDGESPHSSLDHLYALVDLAYSKRLTKIYLHLITDGRDAPQRSALRIIDDIQEKVYGKAMIVSVIGRFFAMDRGKNWTRIKKAYDSLTLAGGLRFEDYHDAIMNAYNQGTTDEFIEPVIVGADRKSGERSRIKDSDAVIFFNLRSDRARQITKCFVQEDDFNRLNRGSFRRKKVCRNLKFCAFTDFGPDLDDVATAFPSADIKDCLPIILKNKKQLYIAETEKFSHITYFINGGFADPVNGEERVRIPSLKIKSYAEKPEMSVYKITSRVTSDIKKNKFEFYAINFANPDMVGHTGDLKATIRAIEHVDICLGKVVSSVLKKHGTIIITADHGNAEQKINLKTNEISTEHTANPVPFILVDDEMTSAKLKQNGSLGNVAPTIYDLLKYGKLSGELSESLIR